MENKLPEHCNQCPNACPADALKCGRGRAYFERLKNGETQEREQSSNPLVRALTVCGQVAAHRSERMRAHGADEAEMFRCLSQEEAQQLQALLTKLEKTWQEEHAKHHHAHDHHDH